MKNLLTLVLSFLFVVLNAQEWRSSLYPLDWTSPDSTYNFYEDQFIQDFSHAGYRLGTEIPQMEGLTIDVTMPPYSADPSGVADATNAIQQAIDEVEMEGGGIVYLPEGTYKISLGEESEALHIKSSNMVLRGAGIDKTFIYNSDTTMNRKVVIRVEAETGSNWDVRPEEYTTLSEDLMGPTQNIPVANASLFGVGDEVIIRNYPTSEWVTEHNEPEWNTSDFFNTLDGVMIYRKITAIDYERNVIRIDAPTRYVFLMRDDASVYRPTSNMLREVGLEDFSIGNKEVVTSEGDWLDRDGGGNLKPGILDNNAHGDETRGAYQCAQSYVFHIERVVDGWMKNVSSYSPEQNVYGTHILSNGLGLFMCRGITVENVSLSHVQYGGGSGNGYAFRIESNDCLLKNVSAEVTRHGFSFIRMYSNGNVIHKGYCKLSGKCTANSTEIVKTGSSGSDFHQWFSPSNLIDQFTVDESYFSALHRKGVGSMHNAVTAHSVFWNFSAMDSPQGYCIRTSQTRTGYIMGTSGNTPKVNYKLSDPRNFLNQGVGGISFAFRYDTDGSRTNPEDIVEGEGIGESLQPQSLYLDQLDRRLNGPPSSSSEVKLAHVKILPNPTSGVINIVSDHSEQELDELYLSDAFGRVLVHNIKGEVDLSDLPKGMYYLIGRKGKLNVLEKVIKL